MGKIPSDEEGGETLSREPDFDDVARLAGELNRLDAKYLVVGGFAIIRHGYPRLTTDIDLLIETSPEIERRVLEALRILPDQASTLVETGDVEKYVVVRIGDEVTVDLMKSGCGVDYAEAIKDARTLYINGVPVPFASPLTLWRMNKPFAKKTLLIAYFFGKSLRTKEPRFQSLQHLPACPHGSHRSK